MLGCSPREGGRRRCVGLMGGNPGAVCRWFCCGASLSAEALAYRSPTISGESLFASFGFASFGSASFGAGLPSEVAAAGSMFGVGASGRDSSVVRGRSGGFPEKGNRSIGSGRSFGAARFRVGGGADVCGSVSGSVFASRLSCALQASEVRPTTRAAIWATIGGKRRGRVPIGLRAVSRMLVLLRIRTKMRDARSRLAH
jgi:hypothetical protein